MFSTLYKTMLNRKDVDHEDYLLVSFVDRCDARGSSWTMGSPKRYFDKL